MKRFFVALLLTACCFAQPNLQAKYGEYEGHRYMHFRCSEQLDLLSEWPKAYFIRINPNELLLRLPDDLPYVPELVWKAGKQIFTTEAFGIPDKESPQ